MINYIMVTILLIIAPDSAQAFATIVVADPAFQSFMLQSLLSLWLLSSMAEATILHLLYWQSMHISPTKWFRVVLLRNGTLLLSGMMLVIILFILLWEPFEMLARDNDILLLSGLGYFALMFTWFSGKSKLKAYESRIDLGTPDSDEYKSYFCALRKTVYAINLLGFIAFYSYLYPYLF